MLSSLSGPPLVEGSPGGSNPCPPRLSAECQPLEMPWAIHSFPAAAVTKAPQTGCLTDIFSLTPLEARSPPSVSLGQNQGVLEICSFWRLEGEIYSLPAASGGHGVPGLMVASLQTLLPPSRCLLLCVSNLPLPLSYKDM